MEITDIKPSIERSIVIGMIVSTDFLKHIRSAYKHEYFKTKHTSLVADWCITYFDIYNKCPGSQIKEIAEDKLSSLSTELAENIRSFLSSISDQYVEDGYNTDYLFDKTQLYFKERSIQLTIDKTKFFLSKGQITEAENEYLNYRSVAVTTSAWCNPFDEHEIEQTFNDKEKGILQLPGALGELLGPLQREWFVGVLGPMKRGKSFWLQEIAIEGVLGRKKVVYINLEMNKDSSKGRIYKRLTGNTDSGGEIRYPVFDCAANQTNSCTKSKRTCNIGCDKVGYIPCDYCRGTNDYESEIFYVTRQAKRLSATGTKQYFRGFQYTYGNNNLWLRTYPAFGACVKDIKTDLDNLELVHGIIPDIIVVDYADILQPDNPNLTGRDIPDNIWKMLKNTAAERKCLVVTASQSTRKSITKKNVTQEDTAEDIRKIAHVDVMISLNQTREEKRHGIMRLGMIAHRHKDFDELKQIDVLQSLEAGQPHLDSFWHPKNQEE